MKTTTIAALAIVWAALAWLFVFLWRKWRPLERDSGEGAPDGGSGREETLAMLARTRDRLGRKTSPAIEDIKKKGGADPKELAARVKAWLNEGDDDKLGE